MRKKFKKIYLLSLILIITLIPSVIVAVDEVLQSSNYNILEEKGYIARIIPEITIEEFSQNFNIDSNKINVFEGEEEKKDGYIKTGMMASFVEMGKKYELSIIGDINCDGLMNQIDLNLLIKHIIGFEPGKLEGVKAISADISGDGKIDQVDMTMLIRYIIDHKLDISEIERLSAPTNLEVSTDGKVTWTASANATGYEISIDGTNWTTATSGIDYNSTITATKGSRTVYVRAINSDSTYYVTPSLNATKTTTVYSLGITKGTGISSVTGVGNYITGRQVTITETASTGYTASGWTKNSGTAPASTTSATTTVTIGADTTLTANATANTYTVSFNANNGSGGQSSNVTATYGSAMPTLTEFSAPTRTGYAFMGYYDNSNYIASDAKQYYTEAGASARNWDKTSATTLYAGWKEKPSQAGTTFTSTEKNNYTDKNGNKATVPKGFTVSGIDGEWNIDTGLVVIAPDGSEFVWVPVNSDLTIKGTNKPIARKTSGKDTNGRDKYQGVLYDYSGTGTSTTSNEMSSYGQNTYNCREPSIVDGTSNGTGTSYDGSSTYYSEAGYESKAKFEEAMQNDYDAMIESVKTYGGYYVGRYEASLNGSKIQVKADQMPMNASSNSANMWYGMYKKQKDYAKDYGIVDVNSSMIWGSQYDGFLNWAIEGADKGHVTSTSYATHNYTYSYTTVKTRTTTENDSISGVDRINNVYDLEGNLREYTLEADDTDNRVGRGGYYSDSYSPFIRRSNFFPPGLATYYSSRPSLYIASAIDLTIDLTAIFDANGGTFGSNTTNTVTYNNVRDGVAQSITGTYKEPTRNDYLFTGWNTRLDGKGNSYKNEKAILENASTVTGTFYAQWKESGLYVGTTKYYALNLDGAMLLSAKSASTPSVTTNTSYTWTSSAPSIVDVSAGGGIIKCGTSTGVATVVCRDSSNNLVGQVDVTSTAKILNATNNTGANINKNRTINGAFSANNPTIPHGYQAIDTGIGLTGEGYTTINATWNTGTTQTNVNKGLVIMDNRGNQFVWVPVPDVIGTPSTTSGVDLASNPSTARPMSRLQSGSTTNYEGNLYEFSGTTTSTYKSDYTVTNTKTRREPAYLSGSNLDDNTSYGKLFTPSELQTNYNSMVASVNRYKGFWMARYEGSWDDSKSKIASIAGARSSDGSQTSTHRWYGLYTAMKNFAGSSSYYTSEMPWGSQYDAMVNWMAKNGVTVGTNTAMPNTENNKSSITGTPEFNDKLKNIVDLYGNNHEYTQEAYEPDGRSVFGGNTNIIRTPKWGGHNGPGSDYSLTWQTARPTLYLN